MYTKEELESMDTLQLMGIAEQLGVKVMPDDELEMVRNYMLGDFCRSYESPFSLSDAWIFIETSGLDRDFYRRALAAVRDTTSDDLLTMAQMYFCKENLIEVVAGKKV